MASREQYKNPNTTATIVEKYPTINTKCAVSIRTDGPYSYSGRQLFVQCSVDKFCLQYCILVVQRNRQRHSLSASLAVRVGTAMLLWYGLCRMPSGDTTLCVCFCKFRTGIQRSVRRTVLYLTFPTKVESLPQFRSKLRKFTQLACYLLAAMLASVANIAVNEAAMQPESKQGH